MEKKEPSYVFGRNVNWCSHCGKQYRGSSKNKKIMLLYDPILRVLDVYPDKNVFQKDACNLMFRAALFTTAKTWKQLKMSINR